MGQNQVDFYSQAQAADFLRDINFKVSALKFRGLDIIKETDLVYGKGGQLPSRKIENIEAPFMGLKYNVAGVATYPGSEAYEITFRCDARMNLRTKLELMSRTIFDDVTSTGDYRIAGKDSLMELMILNKDNTDLRPVKLIGLDLRSIEAMDFKRADGKGDIVEIKTTWSFHFYEYGPEKAFAFNVTIPGIGSVGGAGGAQI